MNSTITEKGQITIPKRIRELLGLKPGVLVTFTYSKGKIFIEKQEQGLTASKWLGKYKLPTSKNNDEYLKKIRGV